jgi:hypothetical protein
LRIEQNVSGTVDLCEDGGNVPQVMPDDTMVASAADADGRLSKKTRICDPKDEHIDKILVTVAMAHPTKEGQIGYRLHAHTIEELVGMTTNAEAQHAAVEDIVAQLTEDDVEVADELLFRVASSLAVAA